MSSVGEIETAVSKLSRQELLAFRDWFTEFDAAAWDKQFEGDVAGGAFGCPCGRGHPGFARAPLPGLVKHRANPKFWQFYVQLPDEIQRLADENYALLKADPGHPMTKSSPAAAAERAFWDWRFTQQLLQRRKFI